MTNPKKAVVVGAGPAGCLAALALAKRGWLVEVYEGRPGESSSDALSNHCPCSTLDIRLPSSKAQAESRSINLAISHRGIAALQIIDPASAHRFLKDAIPMRGRMIHKLSGELDSQIYDINGQVSVHFSLNFQITYSLFGIHRAIVFLPSSA
jgi:kynurenine 3-monooxygenase